MRTKVLAASLVAVLALAGCSSNVAVPASPTAPVATAPGSAAPVGSAQPSLAATASIAPTPAPLATASPTAAALATTYLGLAGKGDAAILACDAAQRAASKDLAHSKLTRAKTAARACLAVFDTYTAGLRATAWGAAQPQADAVAAAMVTIHSLLAKMSDATTAATFRAAYNRMPAATTALRTAANALRAALGLPPA